MKIYIGADYKGFEAKKRLLAYLQEHGYDVVDVGSYQGTEENDFNDPAIAAALAIRGSKVSVGIFGILICDSAHGMTMQANRFKGIRAAHCDSVESAKLAREHDDANVLCLSAHFMNEKTMEKIAEAFINTKFEALERRLKRINRLDERKDYD
ncbi:RpiB/LacA/LacB family sugar-phosphate isomerase [Candidatus Saccharibacteria bacterium]|nr:RpiB/LacA/LacB family sugar-phosphate isomerase [Candidatus Saccharibacteria bacterium]